MTVQRLCGARGRFAIDKPGALSRDFVRNVNPVYARPGIALAGDFVKNRENRRFTRIIRIIQPPNIGLVTNGPGFRERLLSFTTSRGDARQGGARMMAPVRVGRARAMPPIANVLSLIGKPSRKQPEGCGRANDALDRRAISLRRCDRRGRLRSSAAAEQEGQLC